MRQILRNPTIPCFGYGRGDGRLTMAQRASHIVAFAASGQGERNPLLVDGLTARALELSDGTRTVGELATELDGEGGADSHSDTLKWIENLFVLGLIRLHDTRVAPSAHGLVSER